MKTLRTLSFIFCVLSVAFANAQISITLVPSNHYGSNISCYSGSDGSVSAVPTGGNEPYTYLWSTGSSSSSINGLTAGIYSVTVTDADDSMTVASIELQQPDILIASVSGVDISVHGQSNGWVYADVSGGTTPYVYLWSTTDTTSEVDNLPVGTYNVTVTDQNGCTATGGVTLTQPDALVITSLTSPQHNGYNVSCAKGNDGAASVTVTGGIVGTYGYYWTNGTTYSKDKDLTNAIAGTYTVVVFDKGGAKTEGYIELTEPQPISVKLIPSFYPDGYNVSCTQCANGSITATADGGVPSYSYHWDNMQSAATYTNPNFAAGIAKPEQMGVKPPAGFPQIQWDGTSSLSSLMAGDYHLIMSDANGCLVGSPIRLNEPSKNAWSMTGDANTDSTQFIGTTDEKDLVFKTNSSERMRITSDGDFRISNLASDSDTLARAVFVDQSGNLRVVRTRPFSINPCPFPTSNWYTDICNGNQDDIYNNPLSGRVGIGTSYIPNGYKLAVNGKIITEEVKVLLRITWPDYVFSKSYSPMSLKLLQRFITDNRHLPEMPTADEVKDGGVDLGEMQSKLLQKIEELTIYIIQQNKKQEKLEAQIRVLTDKVNGISKHENK